MELPKTKFAVFVIGPPGSGKSSIAKKLKAQFSLKWISAGFLLRKFANTDNSEAARLVKKRLAAGKGADDRLILKMYAENIKTNKKGLIFDGNPGGKSQAEKTIKLLEDNNITLIICLKLKCNKKICKERILKRVHKREDSKLDVIEKRFEWYNTKVAEGYKVIKENAKYTIIVDSSKPISLVIKTILLSKVFDK